MSTRTLPAAPRPTLASMNRLNNQLRRQLAALRHDHAELLVAARAAVVAHFDGDALPVTVLIDTLDQLNALPEYAPQVTDDGLAALATSADTGPPLVGRRVA
ncbi:hypothetical protein ACGFRG_08715 [Streptomyces sp. NPDC048696]|uniref:hypothetical protein n=1 Tax=Streptomyces sp. NPDC048696 TaxID=3365585 RepID=UPI003718CFC5